VSEYAHVGGEDGRGRLTGRHRVHDRVALVRQSEKGQAPHMRRADPARPGAERAQRDAEPGSPPVVRLDGRYRETWELAQGIFVHAESAGPRHDLRRAGGALLKQHHVVCQYPPLVPCGHRQTLGRLPPVRAGRHKHAVSISDPARGM
jgi:hypothetical protein